MERDKGIQIKEITNEDLHGGLLNGFDRTQIVERVWRVIDGKKQVVPCAFTESWNDRLLRDIIFGDFAEAMEFGGKVFLAYEEDHLLGFATLGGEPLGLGGEYLQLIQLHVSFPERGKGVGKKLFFHCMQKAKAMGARKLYISSHSSVETQAFYASAGCVDAKWIFEAQVEHEPYDIQLEYQIQ
jgi:GNAT superfamily N-acetyltransferase